jgi:hypothetical protein
MLFHIGEKGAPALPATPSAMLLACHARIRTFAGVSQRLTLARGAPHEVSEAAGAVARYFTVALPLHEADEEASVAPRLRALGRPELDDALDAMALEHARLHDVLRELSPIWSRLVVRPEDLAQDAGALDEGTRRLDALFGAHLAAEEGVILPALAELSLEEETAIVLEMRHRRLPSGASTT